ncbi:MAG: trimethylamine methyltransferase family protein [Anaerolineae bacterium]
MSDRERRSNRREERRARAGSAAKGAVNPLVNRLPLTEVLGPEGVEAIHRASMRLLQDPGILIIDYPRREQPKPTELP